MKALLEARPPKRKRRRVKTKKMDTILHQLKLTLNQFLQNKVKNVNARLPRAKLW